MLAHLHLRQAQGPGLTLALTWWSVEQLAADLLELRVRFRAEALDGAARAALQGGSPQLEAALQATLPGSGPLRLVLTRATPLALAPAYGAPGEEELVLQCAEVRLRAATQAEEPAATQAEGPPPPAQRSPPLQALVDPSILRGYGRVREAGSLHATGVDPDTGEYLLPPLSPRDVAAIALGQPARAERPELLQAWLSPLLEGEQELTLGEEPEEAVAERRTLAARRQGGELGVIDGVDPADLAEAGWGVVFIEGHPGVEAHRRALAPLLARRRAQAGARYRELRWRPGWRKADFLAEYGAGFGRVDPERLPYYLLLVGSPEHLPFHVQEQLSIQHAVGRLWFDDPEAWARYAASVVAAEESRLRRDSRARFLGTTDDEVTAHATMGLLHPLAEELQEEGHAVDLLPGPEATRDALLRAMDEAALVFTATHGLGARRLRRPEQLLRQGALLTQGWRGVGQPVDPACTLGGDQIPDDADVHGLISVHLACFGAGTPRVDRFGRALLSGQGLLPRRALAPRPMVSWLPQRLLGHPAGGALAVISHVDRAWETSFSHFATRGGPRPRELAHFQHLITRLHQGLPVGAAFEDFGGWFAEKDSQLRELLQQVMQGEAVDDEELALAWTAAKDAQGWVLLGDPAVRLRTA